MESPMVGTFMVCFSNSGVVPVTNENDRLFETEEFCIMAIAGRTNEPLITRMDNIFQS
jgi:hypothetical protein